MHQLPTIVAATRLEIHNVDGMNIAGKDERYRVVASAKRIFSRSIGIRKCTR